MSKTLEKIKQYKNLYEYTQNFITEDNKGEYLSDLCFWFKLQCLKNDLDEQEVFKWDDHTAEEFYSWGHNSRWANVFEVELASDLEKYLNIALQIAEEYGDINNKETAEELNKIGG